MFICQGLRSCENSFMRYHALACDYDGTIAWDGEVSEDTILALQEVRKSGRKLILVTGRELDDLIKVFPRIDLFDRVVAENGALLYRPATREERPLAHRPPDEFWQQLIKRGADRVSVGRVIVATWRPHEKTAVELIRDLGLELQITFNKGAVMILPSGVNKATGLKVALTELGLSPHNVVGIGDAENDHAFLALCECSVAVENAVDTLKERVDWVTKEGHGEGTIELIQALVATDLSFLSDSGTAGKTGRPHWIAVDESHHVLPSSWEPAGVTVSQSMYGLMVVTLEPDRVDPAVLSSIDVVIAIGKQPAEIMNIFRKSAGESPASLESVTLQQGEALAWLRDSGKPPFVFQSSLPRAERRRHRRKYAEGELRPDLCFYFRGPEGKLNLKAQNLAVFLQMGDGVDDETWLFHLKNGDISGWFHNVIKDP